MSIKTTAAYLWIVVALEAAAFVMGWSFANAIGMVIGASLVLLCSVLWDEWRHPAGARYRPFILDLGKPGKRYDPR